MAILRLTGGRTLDVEDAMADMLLMKKNDKKIDKGQLYHVGNEVYLTLSEIRGLEKRKAAATFGSDKYNIYEHDQRNIILEFEKDMDGRTWEQYCLDKGYKVITDRYPNGAMLESRLGEYQMAHKKYQGLNELQFNREKANLLDTARITSLIENMTV
tara:strand:+ start:108 stop:578 length:471 start_codon:yes stop_codon:yes gene_type:complete